MRSYSEKSELTRRNILKTTVPGLMGILGIAKSSKAAAEGDVELNFEAQESDGESVVIEYLKTDMKGDLRIIDDAQGKNKLFGKSTYSAGTEKENITIDLDEPIEESQTIRASFLGPIDGEQERSIQAMEEAYVAVGEDIPENFGTEFYEARPEDGFNYPYYLFVPPDVESDAAILVEPNNTGSPTDDFDQHRSEAENRISRGTSRSIAEDLSVPFLVPVFPRPRSEPVDGTHYTHQLDRETLEIEGTDLERIDQQLLAMVDHVRENLDVEVREKIMLNGFSASGNFSDRFTVLHPDRVLSVTAGGLNGMAMLPTEEFEGETLPYHVGIADVEDLTGKSVDLEALDDVNQLLYMGAEDYNDTIPYDDAWTREDLRELALEVYGEDMITERFPTCQEVYQEAGIEAQFKIYADAGHTPRPASDDIKEVHRRSLNGEDISHLGDELGFQAEISVDPKNPESGQTVTFDASDASIVGTDIVMIAWYFDDEATAAGTTVTHSFDKSGTQTVEIRAIDGNGAEHTHDFEVDIEATESTATETDEPEESTTTETDEPEESTTTETDEPEEPTTTETDEPEEPTTTETDEPEEHTTTDGEENTHTSTSGPGFGVSGALTGVGGMAYLLKRRLTSSIDEQD